MPKKKLSEAAREFFREAGRKGGKLSGKIRKDWSEEKKSELGRKAAEARWKKERPD